MWILAEHKKPSAGFQTFRDLECRVGGAVQPSSPPWLQLVPELSVHLGAPCCSCIIGPHRTLLFTCYGVSLIVKVMAEMP